MALDAIAIHAALGTDGWTRALINIGIDDLRLRNLHGPCPLCGGKDRFRYDNKGMGKWICSQCGAGDGFKLTMRFLNLGFRDACQRIIEAAGLEGSVIRAEKRAQREFAPPPIEKAEPPQRVKALMRESCIIENCDAAVIYLQSRALWPLPRGHRWRAHPCVDYYDFATGRRVGRYPALIAEVRDIASELVTLHVTYLEPDGRKLSQHEPRKILSKMTGRESCSIQMMHIEGDVMGVGEGIETSLSASRMFGIPVWPALNTSLLKAFTPPPNIKKLTIFADKDVGGLEAAAHLMERLQEKVRLELKVPRSKNCNDWNDEWVADAGR